MMQVGGNALRMSLQRFGPAFFIFSGLDGTISAWNPALTGARRKVDNSAAGAVYTGVTLANNATGTFVLAANMGTNAIDVFDSKFAATNLVGKFVDPTLPPGFAPSMCTRWRHGVRDVCHADARRWPSADRSRHGTRQCV